MPTSCPTVQQLICANGRNAVKTYDNDECCFQYECQCVCSVWSGSHYKTFDGNTYDFNKNCTYYLVKEIITKYNLSILVNNHDCDPTESTFCSQDLIVIYQSYKVVFTQEKTSESSENAVYLNDKRIYPAYSNSVLRFTSTDMVVTMEIPGIDVEVVYRASSFSIDLPYSLFEGNTEGQCGTCDNYQPNDCRSPNGQMESCSDSAGQWSDPSSPCINPTTTTAPTSTTKPPFTTSQPTCKPAICDLLKTSVFEPCHSVISPGPYVTTCVSDICKNGNNTCTSLEAYATECSNAGVCIDWRNATKGQCEHKCPIDQVYKACGPKVELTCNGRYNKKFQASMMAANNNSKEGCFCTNGATLFNPEDDTCVESCYCVGPTGKPQPINETWTVGCSLCGCDTDSMSVKCKPVVCPTIPSPICNPPYKLVETDGCCPKLSCECDLSLCPTLKTCKPGFQLNITNSTCCQSYECVPKGVCVYNMTEYKPGAKIPWTPGTTPEPPTEAPSTSELTSKTTAPPPGPGQPSGTTAAPSGPGQPKGTTAAPSGPGQPLGTTAAPSGPGQPKGTTAAPSGPGQPLGTTAAPSGPGQPKGTTAAPSGPGQPKGTTAAPSGPGQPKGTTAAPSGPGQPKGTTAPQPGPGQPKGTTAPQPGPGQPKGTTAPQPGEGGSTMGPISEESTTPGPCKECYCGPKMDPNTKLNGIMCKPIVCNKKCSIGYEYQTTPDKCCGTCVQTACVVVSPDNTSLVIEVDKTSVSPTDKCVQYTCLKIDGKFHTKETETICPQFNPLDCVPGTETTDANGCCKSCKPRAACEVVQSNETVIEVGGCKSTQPVNMAYCAGHCGSMSMYSAAANMMMHKCECCQEARTSQIQVELTCADNSKVQHSYTLVEACRCTPAECVPGTTPRSQRRRRR
uniref:Mucin-2-like n=1 Tax=Scophthalmus maximus TaxID=52904 RepID=A0A8D3ASU7_SCOMX